MGHFVEAQILETLEVDFIDECEALTTADPENHINKHKFQIPFVCGCGDLGEALRRVAEGAAMLRTKGGDSLAETVRKCRSLLREAKRLTTLDHSELFEAAKVRLLCMLVDMLFVRENVRCDENRLTHRIIKCGVKVFPDLAVSCL